jgi:c-di-GMP-binding flagellar brake protein YcgR
MPRPVHGDQITLLFEDGSRPISTVTTVEQVSESSLVAVRSGDTRAGAPSPGTDGTVLFVDDGQLYQWSVRFEEVLPSSYFLVSTRTPGHSDRREFVRADLGLHITLRPVDGEPGVQVEGLVDLSASGFRLDCERDFPADVPIDVQIRVVVDEPVLVHAIARVARPKASGSDTMAFEFIEIDSADEERLVALVLGARAQALQRRIGSL